MFLLFNNALLPPPEIIVILKQKQKQKTSHCTTERQDGEESCLGKINVSNGVKVQRGACKMLLVMLPSDLSLVLACTCCLCSFIFNSSSVILVKHDLLTVFLKMAS